MTNKNKKNFLFQEISTLKGVGSKIKKYLDKKRVEKIKDLLWDLPYSAIDRSKITSLSELEIGKITSVQVKVLKYNFPRIRNLPFKVICSEGKNKINIIFFNSYEGYIRKVLPINNEVIISGKINYYKKNYQITNPTYIKPIDKKDEIAKIFPKYSLTEGLNEKVYRKLIMDVLYKMDESDEWHDENFLKDNNFNKFKKTFLNLHNPSIKNDIFSDDYKRIAYDEIFANLLVLFSARKSVKINKKRKIYSEDLSNKIISTFPFNLTKSQLNAVNELNEDIRSDNRMFRLLQGDVGSGKTIVSFIAAANVVSSSYQVALMAPTEILAKQHYNSAKKLFSSTNIRVALLTGKSKHLEKKNILNQCKNYEIDFLIGTHSLFQNKIKFKNLGLIIIDEQHKFGVKQRLALAKKGGNNCDVLLMSATPIPRTMMLSIFGDMDVSILKEKPKNRKDVITLTKPENKINELWPLLKKQLLLNRQIFWVCPLIENSSKLDFESVEKKYNLIKRIFPKKVGFIHGSLNERERKNIMKKFTNKEIKILVTTTVIEVGIDFPDANVIIIENSNKFGLSQLHQLRGRVGRGNNESYCIMLYKNNLSDKAKKRLKILKKTNDGFIIAEEDLKIRGHGDILGYQQSGIKNFRFADPIHHKNLFFLAEKHIKNVNKENIKNYETLIKLYDKAEIINEIGS